jgi:hypothetical protein
LPDASPPSGLARLGRYSPSSGWWWPDVYDDEFFLLGRHHLDALHHAEADRGGRLSQALIEVWNLADRSSGADQTISAR